MARVQPSSIVHTVRGSVGQETYQIDRNRQIVRSKPIPTPPPAQGQTGHDAAKLQAWIDAEAPVRAAAAIWRRLKAGDSDAPTASLYRAILDSGPDRGTTYRALVRVCADTYYGREPDWPFNPGGHHVTVVNEVFDSEFNSWTITMTQPHPHVYWSDALDLDVTPPRTLANPRPAGLPVRPAFDWVVTQTGIFHQVPQTIGLDDGSGPQFLWIWPVITGPGHIVTAIGKPFMKRVMRSP